MKKRCFIIVILLMLVCVLINNNLVKASEVIEPARCWESDGKSYCEGDGIKIIIERTGEMDFARQVWNKTYYERKRIELKFFCKVQSTKLEITVKFGEGDSLETPAGKKGDLEKIEIYISKNEDAINENSDLPHEIAHAVQNQKIKYMDASAQNLRCTNEGLALSIEYPSQIQFYKNYVCNWTKNDKWPDFNRALDEEYVGVDILIPSIMYENYAMYYAITQFLLSKSKGDLNKVLNFATSAKKKGSIQIALKDFYCFESIDDFINKLKEWIKKECQSPTPFETNIKCSNILESDTLYTSCRQNKCIIDIIKKPEITTECKCASSIESECKTKIDKPIEEGGCGKKEEINNIECTEKSEGECSTKNFNVKIDNSEKLTPSNTCCTFARESQYNWCTSLFESINSNLNIGYFLSVTKIHLNIIINENVKNSLISNEGIGVTDLEKRAILVEGPISKVLEVIKHEIQHLATYFATANYPYNELLIKDRALYLDEGLSVNTESQEMRCKLFKEFVKFSLTINPKTGRSYFIPLVELNSELSSIGALPRSLMYAEAASITEFLIKKSGGRCRCSGKQKVMNLYRKINSNSIMSPFFLFSLDINSLEDIDKLWKEDLKKQVNLHPVYSQDSDGDKKGKEIDRREDPSRWLKEIVNQASCNPCTCKE